MGVGVGGGAVSVGVREGGEGKGCCGWGQGKQRHVFTHTYIKAERHERLSSGRRLLSREDGQAEWAEKTARDFAER